MCVGCCLVRQWLAGWTVYTLLSYICFVPVFLPTFFFCYVIPGPLLEVMNKHNDSRLRSKKAQREIHYNKSPFDLIQRKLSSLHHSILIFGLSTLVNFVCIHVGACVTHVLWHWVITHTLYRGDILKAFYIGSLLLNVCIYICTKSANPIVFCKLMVNWCQNKSSCYNDSSPPQKPLGWIFSKLNRPIFSLYCRQAASFFCRHGRALSVYIYEYIAYLAISGWSSGPEINWPFYLSIALFTVIVITIDILKTNNLSGKSSFWLEADIQCSDTHNRSNLYSYSSPVTKYLNAELCIQPMQPPSYRRA